MRNALARIDPVWLVLFAIASVQLGAAFAKDLFSTTTPTATAWLRLCFASLIFLTFARPRLRGRSRRDWLIVIGYGLSLAGMNWAIYESFARIPIGVAVTVEFLGPLAVAVAGSRRARDLIWVGLAALGVALLGFQPDRTRLDRARPGPVRRSPVGGLHPARRAHRGTFRRRHRGDRRQPGGGRPAGAARAAAGCTGGEPRTCWPSRWRSA
ncbi:MAG: hypothetical protein R2719_05480 [Micropruina sp.]